MASTINASTSPAAIVQTADGTGILALQTAGTTAVTIDASQNVCIGNTPTAAYALVKNFQVGQVQYIFANNSNAGGGFLGNAYLDATATMKYATTNAATYYNNQGGVHTWSYAASGTAGNTVTFTEAMRIDSSGVLLVNTTSYNSSVSSSGKFQVQNSAAEWCGAFQNNNAGTAYGLYVRYYNAAPNSVGSEFLYCNDSGTLRATIRSNGGIGNYSANNANLSDIREKTNIELASSYLDKICAIPVKTFNYIDQNMEEDGGLTLGVIAQDVQAVAPKLISESNWAGKDEPEKLRLSIYQTDLQYALMKCIQEQQALITSLTARITALEGA